MSRPLSVLLLEDSRDDARLILHELRRAGFDPAADRVDCEADFLARLDPAPEVILADYHLPQFDALRALALVRDRGLDVPFLIVTGVLGDEAAVECIRQGASDYLLKDRLGRLGQAVAQALEQKQARDDRRLVGSALRESEARKTAILETALDGILTIDHQGRVLEFNPAAEAIFGSTRAEVAGRSFVDLIVPPTGRDWDRRDPAIADCIPLGRRVEMTAVRAGGEVFPVELAVTRIREVGPSLFTAYVRDITERKRAEEELRVAKEAAETANRAKDRFLATLSHELRNPLSPVLLVVSAMLGDPATDENLRPILTMIKDNVELEARLIVDLLDVTRIAQGKMHLNREVVDVHAVIRRALETCGKVIDPHKFRLKLDLAAGEHHVNADPVRLQQIFWNLTQNAVKFSPSGGEILIRSRTEAGADTGRRLVVQVSDTGIGIEPAIMPRIFRAFEQGDDSITRRFGGLGLGLAICHAVAEAHGGRLTAASAGAGRGATFTLELPMNAGPGPDRPGRPPLDIGAAGPGPLRILLVEDNHDTLWALSTALGWRGYTVRTAVNLASARELVASEAFGLVISDIGLPDGSGHELMRELSKTHDLPGIAMSGYGSDDDIREAKSAGFAAHLTKPVTFQDLESLVRALAPSRDRAADFSASGSLR